jgi:hypothetical protein
MYEISAQMIEIYNEQIRDLLGSNGPEKRYPLFSLKGYIMESVIESTNVTCFLLVAYVHVYLLCVLICFFGVISIDTKGTLTWYELVS